MIFVEAIYGVDLRDVTDVQNYGDETMLTVFNVHYIIKGPMGFSGHVLINNSNDSLCIFVSQPVHVYVNCCMFLGNTLFF